MTEIIFSSTAKMQQPVLPHFPEEPLDQESLDRLSDELIKAYSACRVTTPLRLQALIKRTPVRLNFGATDKQSIQESEKTFPETDLAEPTSAVDASEKNATETTEVPRVLDDGQKCFLHPKPKPSCKRCQAYLSIKKGTGEPSPKKPRP
jgi:hypothetical protein